MGTAPHRRLTILVIDDDPDFRAVMGAQLEALGLHVVVASDGVDGLLQLERVHPDAVLCDLSMPIMDGLEFGRRMRQDSRFRDVLLIAVTGFERQADVRDTWTAGYDGHVMKPVTGDVLARLVRRRLSGGSGNTTETA